MTPAGRIIVLGATGFSGRLIAQELAREGPPELVLAARDPKALDRLAAGLVGRGAPRPPAIAPTDVTDPGSLRRLVRARDVVINCAGPFAPLGEPVIRRCIQAGAHYLDLTGEQPWMRAMHARHDAAARAAGVIVVNGMAFEWALGDCAAVLLAASSPIRSLDVVYAWRAAATSRGTRRTSLRIAGTRAWELEHGRWRRRPPGARRRAFRLDSGRTLDAVTFGAGEVVTVPRWSEAVTVRGWLVLGSGSARLATAAAPLLPILVPLLRPVLEPLVSRPADPSAADRDASRFTIRLEATGADGQRRSLEVRGSDPYGLTAAIAARGALRALAGAGRAGVLAPSRLVEPAAFLGSLPIEVAGPELLT